MPDHIFNHLHDHNYVIYRGVAQLVARDIWDVEAAGSNPVTPTIVETYQEVSFDFLFFLIHFPS